MSFFDQPAKVTRFKLVHAVWRRQRMEVLPGVAPVALLLARTDDTVVGLTDVRGYPNGFVFLLRLRWALVADRYEQLPWPFPDWGSPDPLDGDLFPEELLRFGVQFADGRRVTNMDRYPFVPSLPTPPGPLAFVCAWPGRGIPTSRVEVDGAAIREAANAAITLWSNDPDCSTTDALRQSEGVDRERDRD